MSDRAIVHFSGPYRFLSNFELAMVEFDGVEYPSVEHAYQAAKTHDPVERERIAAASGPGRAKSLGAKVRLRRGWDGIRVHVMSELLRQKFADPDLGRALLATGDAYLMEGNDWGDRFWGVVDGEGANWLGVLLMEIRQDLRSVSTDGG